MKFRGKDIETMDWRYGYYYVNEKHEHVIVDGYESYKVDPSTLGMSTGMLSAGGDAEIYEGDIIKHRTTGAERVVSWCEAFAAFMVSDDLRVAEPVSLDVYHLADSDYAGDQQCDIVGNVIDNEIKNR